VPLPETVARGVNFAHQHRRGSGYGSERAASQLDALVALGVRDLVLNPFAYAPTLGSSDIQWGGDPTLTDDGWARWFDAYTRYVVHHARIAQAAGCARLCVGLEYTRASRDNPGGWAAVASACRAVLSGTLCYAANWYEEYAQFTDWDAFDCIGIAAYFPLTGTTVEELTASWDTHLDAIARVTKGHPVVFPEAGYRAVVGATEKPWESGDGTPDPALQARAYEALLRACAARPWFHGAPG
jgi:hypothetical protein